MPETATNPRDLKPGRERLLDLADFLETIPDYKNAERLGPSAVNSFSMSTWAIRSECGAVACIAGWAAIRYGTPSDACHMEARIGGLNGIGARLLGISYPDAEDLFYGAWARGWPPERSLRDGAVDQLRCLARKYS